MTASNRAVPLCVVHGCRHYADRAAEDMPSSPRAIRRLRDALYHWARVAVQHDPASKAKYAALRARGHGHARGLRSVADRLLAVACAMLRCQTCYQPDHPAENHAA